MVARTGVSGDVTNERKIRVWKDDTVPFVCDESAIKDEIKRKVKSNNFFWGGS